RRHTRFSRDWSSDVCSSDLPAIIISLSSFTRIIIVFHFLRQGLGTQEAPSNQILIGLALFLSFFIMNPTLTAIYDHAYVPWSKRSEERRVGKECRYRVDWDD